MGRGHRSHSNLRRRVWNMTGLKLSICLWYILMGTLCLTGGLWDERLGFWVGSGRSLWRSRRTGWCCRRTGDLARYNCSFNRFACCIEGIGKNTTYICIFSVVIFLRLPKFKLLGLLVLWTCGCIERGRHLDSPKIRHRILI